MLDWAGLLGRKYDILQQQADTQRMGMRADANLANVRAGLLPIESKANVGLTEAQTGFTDANAGLATSRARATDEEAKYIGPIAKANIGESQARGRLYGSQATGEDQLNQFNRFRFRGLGDNYGRLDDFIRSSMRFGMGPFAGEY